MAILQVKVRPAVRFRTSDHSQRSEQSDHSPTFQQAAYQRIDSPSTQHATIVGNAIDRPRIDRYRFHEKTIQRADEQPATERPTVDMPTIETHRWETHSTQPTSKPQSPYPTIEEHAIAYPSPTVQKTMPFSPTATAPTNQEALLEPSSFRQKIVWKLMPATTVGRALNSARERLNEADCSTASLDAQVILAHVLGVERSWLFAHHEYKLSTKQAEVFTDLIARRMEHEPVAYLIGRREFYGLDFSVDRRVLIPRPETELLVDAVLDYSTDSGHNRVVVADVGTGSGAIALSIANHCAKAQIYAIDLSEDALEVAHRNLVRLDCHSQVTLAQGDLLTPLPERVHVIVANLPYISSDIYCKLDVDVRDYEPQLALEAGPEGLDVIQRLLQQATRYLQPNGVIYLEIGHDQGEAVRHLAHSFFPTAQHISVRQDYHGRDRLVTIIP